MREWFARCIDWCRRRRLDAELADELRFHQAQLERDARAAGLADPDAAWAARRRLGNLTRIREAARERWSVPWLDHRLQDLRDAMRGLRRSPGFALCVILTCAFGIGANATMFNVIDRLLLRPPARIMRPENVYTIHALPRDAISFPAFTTLRDNLSSVATISAQTAPWELSIGRGDQEQVAQTVFVDGGYFRTLGVPAVAGRLFTDDDMRLPDGQPVVVIGYGLWERRFNRDPSAVGRELVISTTRVRIVGVAPEDFHGVGTRPVDLWLPLTLARSLLPGVGPQWPWMTADNAWLLGIARIAPQSDPRAMAARATALLRFAATIRPTRDTATVELHSILPWARAFSPEAKIAALLGGISILVFLIGCSNATNLMLTRAVRRRREIGMRVALGVSRPRLLAGLFADALVLAAIGGIAGCLIAAAGTALMRNVLLTGFAWSGGLLDGRSIVFIAGVSVVAGIVTGVVPPLALLRGFNVRDAIAGGHQSGSVHRHRVISMLVVAQTAMSAVLLIGALLFTRSLANVRSVPLGIDTEHTVLVSLTGRTFRASAARAQERFAELRDVIAQVPGVASVAMVEGAPFSRHFLSTQIGVPGRSDDAPIIQRGAFIRAVTSSYFATIGTRIIRGRAFTESDDHATAEPIAIVSAVMANTLWPAGDAVGHCVRLGVRPGADTMPCRRIVGIAEETQESAIEPNGPTSPYASIVYVPLTQGRHSIRARVLIARIPRSPADVITRVRASIQRAEPNMPLAKIALMQSLLDPERRPWRLGATMCTLFGGLAVVLATLGLYGVVSYSVTQRTREMGIRIALGATGADILSLIGREGAWLGALGVLLAMLCAALVAPFIQPLLFQISARSASVYLLVGGAMLVVAIAASLVPAVRAARVSPISVMRSD